MRTIKLLCLAGLLCHPIVSISQEAVLNPGHAAECFINPATHLNNDALVSVQHIYHPNGKSTDYNTTFLIFDSPLEIGNINFGLTAMLDDAGICTYNSWRMQGQVKYRLRLGSGYLNTGLGIGLDRFRLADQYDFNRYTPGLEVEWPDYNLSSWMMPSLSGGLFYDNRSISLGVSADHLFAKSFCEGGLELPVKYSLGFKSFFYLGIPMVFRFSSQYMKGVNSVVKIPDLFHTTGVAEVSVAYWLWLGAGYRYTYNSPPTYLMRIILPSLWAFRFHYDFGCIPSDVSGARNGITTTHQIGLVMNFEISTNYCTSYCGGGSNKSVRYLNSPSGNSKAGYMGNGSKSTSTGSNTSNNTTNGSGKITAGEFSDFAKWDLWTGKVKDDLADQYATWKMKATERYTVQVVSMDQKPVADCPVELINRNGVVLWTSRTDNTGKAELWTNAMDLKEERVVDPQIIVNRNGMLYTIEKPLQFKDGINLVELSEYCNNSNDVDILFVVDATGSMGDEIEYLKTELLDVINSVKDGHKDLNFRLGSLFYRCSDNSYVTKFEDLSPDFSGTMNFIRQQAADEGGTEAVEIALDESIDKISWSKSARARIIFIVLDESPDWTDEVILKYGKAIKKAAEKGIRIIPVVASGVSTEDDRRLEYLMRFTALATNGRYIFLTNHSGVGSTHTVPLTDEYNVEYINKLLLRVIHESIDITPCSIKDQEASVSDTLYVFNPVVIAHEKTDISLGPDSAGYTQTLVFVTAETSEEIEISVPDSLMQIPGENPKSENDSLTPFVWFRYFPNPTEGPITIEFNGDVSEIFLADISGKLLTKYDVQGKTVYHADLSQYPSGIYYLKYKCDDRWLGGKIILKRY